MTNDVHLHWVHGCRVESAAPMAALLDGGQPDVRLGAARRRRIPGEPPAGQILLEGAGAWPTWISDHGSGYVMRYGERYDFEIDADLTVVEPWVDPAADIAFADVLLHGAVLSALLSFRGAHCLHATTIAFGDRGVSVFGPSGRGKSTTAALLVAAGGILLTDDVTVLYAHDRRRVHPGPLELRLRPAAFELADLLPDATQRSTADGRLAVRPAAEPPHDGVPLAAAVMPTPRRDSATAASTRLAPMEAIGPLLASSRLVGWRSAALLRQEFEAVTDLADRVPVHVLDVPWGPPFAEDLPARLRELIEADHPAGDPARR